MTKAADLFVITSRIMELDEINHLGSHGWHN